MRFPSDYLERAHRSISEAVRDAEAFDDTFDDKLMSEEDRRSAKEALATIGAIVRKWRRDPRVYNTVVTKTIRLKKNR